MGPTGVCLPFRDRSGHLLGGRAAHLRPILVDDDPERVDCELDDGPHRNA